MISNPNAWRIENGRRNQHCPARARRPAAVRLRRRLPDDVLTPTEFDKRTTLNWPGRLCPSFSVRWAVAHEQAAGRLAAVQRRLDAFTGYDPHAFAMIGEFVQRLHRFTPCRANSFCNVL